MKQRSPKEKFYSEVGEAMFMNNMRSFINIETLEVEIHPGEDYFSFEDMEDTAQEAIDNPGKFLTLEQQPPWESFKVMEAFIETIKEEKLQFSLAQALQGKRPFANFKNIIDNSSERQNWFDYRDEAYAEIAKEWLNRNATDKLKVKINLLSSFFEDEK